MLRESITVKTAFEFEGRGNKTGSSLREEHMGLGHSYAKLQGGRSWMPVQLEQSERGPGGEEAMTVLVVFTSSERGAF